jgi:nitrite reductase/ring-hydroxylating ferredoxin subunit/uncharacterized membrane protein
LDGTNAVARALDAPVLDNLADPLSRAVKGAYEAAGPVGERLKDAMHGVWLRHPLHPVFTDIPIGAWTAGLVLDACADGDSGMERAADIALGVGLVGAAGAAITGLTDWSETSGRSQRTGLIHGLLNIAATTMLATSYILRKRGARDAGKAWAIAGYGIATGSAWLGGDLVYDQRIGVTHAVVDGPETFTRVASSGDVAEDSLARATSGTTDVLLARDRGRLCALAHPCSHMGGPLSEGKMEDGAVVCPWHGSKFRLDDGSVLRGPATQAQPRFDVREQNGGIEVKAADQ